MNLGPVAELPTRPIVSVWYRAIPPQYLATALNYKHTREHPSRYYDGPSAPVLHDILYFAENPSLALFEVEAQFGSSLTPGGIIPNPARPWLIMNIQVQLTWVADLTNLPEVQPLLSTSAQELTGDWLGYAQHKLGAAPTQELGDALYSCRQFEGFLTVSAKQPFQTILAVFPELITTGNFIQCNFTDAEGQVQRLCIP